MERQRHAVVLGGGVGGLTVADRLSADGWRVSVFEREPHWGGLARGVHFDGSRVDLGPHNVRAKYPDVYRYYQELLGDDLLRRHFHMKVLFRGRLLSYPARPWELLGALSPQELARCAWGLGGARLRRQRPPPGASFAQWTRSQYGDALFEQFFEPLTRKVWGLEAEALGDRLARDRVPSPWGRRGHHPEHPTRAAHFYPRKGVVQIVEAQLERLRRRGVALHGATAVERVEFTPRPRVRVGGQWVEADRVVSSLPLEVLRGVTEGLPLPTTRLAYRSLGLCFVGVSRSQRLPASFSFVVDEEVSFFRATDFSYCSEAPLAEGRNVWCFEFPAASAAEAQAFGPRVIGDLVRLGWLPAGSEPPWEVHFQPHVYPIYLRGHEEDWGHWARFFAKDPPLHLVGRQGLFRHANIDDVMDGALRLGELLRQPAPLQAWEAYYGGGNA